MHRSFPFLLALGLLLAPTLNALSLNPFNWFGGSSDSNSIDASSETQDAATKLLAVAKEKYDAGKLRSAKRTLKKVIKKYPASSSTGEALTLRANIYMSTERWPKGFDDLQSVITEHPDYENFDRLTSLGYVSSAGFEPNEATENKANRLLRALRKTTFRPRFENGEPTPTDNIVKAYAIPE